jgi:hypothetical protein
MLKLHAMFFFFFMKGSNYSHKLMYNKYLKLICRYLLDNMYIELVHMKILYGRSLISIQGLRENSIIDF